MMAAMIALSACTAGAQDEGMVLIEGGTFQMGSPTAEPERDADETLHEVAVADFMMSRTEVSQQEYERVMGKNPSSVKDPSAFYRIWTLKESFVKLTGQGLLIPLSSFEITLDPTTVRQEYISADIELKEYGQIDGYQYSCMALQGHMADEMICVDLREALIKIQTGGGEV